MGSMENYGLACGKFKEIFMSKLVNANRRILSSTSLTLKTVG